MSLWLIDPAVFGQGFPRVSGDEPAVAGGNADTFKFSPRERG